MRRKLRQKQRRLPPEQNSIITALRRAGMDELEVALGATAAALRTSPALLLLWAHTVWADWEALTQEERADLLAVCGRELMILNKNRPSLTQPAHHDAPYTPNAQDAPGSTIATKEG